MSQQDPYQPPQQGDGVPPSYGTPPAPGQVPPYPAGPAPQPLAPAVPPFGLATATVALAVVWAALQAVTMISFVVAFPSGQQALEAGQDLPAGLLAVYGLLGNLWPPVVLAAYLVGCFWLYRSRQFAQAVEPQFPHARDSVWVWLGWVVPIVAFWFPLQVVRDVRAATVGRRSTKGLAWWWAPWLLSFLTFEYTSSTHPSLVPQLVVEIVTGLATVLAAVMWIRIVREISAAQRARLQHGRPGGQG